MLDEGESLEWAARLGIPAPRAVELTADAVDGGLPFPGPYVVKVAAPALGHKSEAGGVLLGVADGRALTGAVARMAADVERATGQVLERVRVAAQVTPLAELMLGYRRDPVFGPVVILSAGGIDVELTETRAIRLAPVDEATAAAMIDGLPLARRLAGYRGRAAADRRALVRAIVAMSAPGCDVIEAEINPLGAFEDGVLALDALFVVEDKGEER